jgi:arabinofuranosyltransferase
LVVSSAWCAACVFAGGDHFAGFRFLVPALAPIVVLVIGLLVQPPQPALRATPPFPNARFALAVAVGVLINLSVLKVHGAGWVREEVELARNWANAGRWLADNTPPGATICVPVAGAIPYYARRPVLDMLGLVDRHIARAGKVAPDEPAGHQRSDTEYVLSRAPEYIVYPSSGCCPAPKHADDPFHTPTAMIAFRELIADPRTRERYTYYAAEIAGGRWIEFLQLRPKK